MTCSTQHFTQGSLQIDGPAMGDKCSLTLDKNDVCAQGVTAHEPAAEGKAASKNRKKGKNAGKLQCLKV